MKKILKDKIHIDKKDWEYIKAALICYELDPFGERMLKDKVSGLRDKYS